jgi:hypothetical protein
MKTYQKPTLVRRESLVHVAAGGPVLIVSILGENGTGNGSLPT